MSWAGPVDRRNFFTLEETQKLLLIGKVALETRINDGRVFAFKRFHRWIIPKAAVELYLREESLS